MDLETLLEQGERDINHLEALGLINTLEYLEACQYYDMLLEEYYRVYGEDSE